MKLSSNVVYDSDEEKNFPHKLLLTNSQVSRLHKVFANGSLTNTKLSKTQLHKIGRSREILGNFLGPLLKPGLPLTRKVLKVLSTIRTNSRNECYYENTLVNWRIWTIKNEAKE